MLREEYHPKNVAKKKDLESFRESVKNNLSNLSSSVDVINELKEKHAAIEDSVNENKFNIQRISEGHKEKVEKDSYKIKNMERMIDELRERVEILKKPDIYPKLKLPEKNIQREEFPNVLDNSERHLERVKKYIKECLKKKHSPEKIKQTLIDSGWDEDKIKVAFNNLE